MLLRTWRGRGFRATAMLLAGGVVIQTTSCASFGAEVAYGLTTSIASEFIRNFISDAFGTSTGLSGLL